MLTRRLVSNFNHERFMMCCGVIRMSRTVVEECLKWCNQRIVFGKKLIEQPTIRQKCVPMRNPPLMSKHGSS